MTLSTFAFTFLLKYHVSLQHIHIYMACDVKYQSEHHLSFQASNDLSTAVSLYLEELAFMSRRRNNSLAPQHLPPTMLEYDPSFRRYRHMVVDILGLPEGWEARVCSITGVVLFEHLPTGTKQNQVPPGFADALPVPTSTSSTGTSNDISCPNPFIEEEDGSQGGQQTTREGHYVDSKECKEEGEQMEEEVD